MENKTTSDAGTLLYPCENCGEPGFRRLELISKGGFLKRLIDVCDDDSCIDKIKAMYPDYPESVVLPTHRAPPKNASTDSDSTSV